MPGWPQGALVFREGPMMASSDKVYTTLSGRGGHDAMPHRAVGEVTLQGPALTGGEDFAFMLHKRPGCYLLISHGDGDSAGACMVHNPGFNFNDGNVVVGAAYGRGWPSAT